MKIIALGDIHGRDCWKDIVAKHPDADKYVFLGDYVSSHDMVPGEQQCTNLREILDFKEANSDKVVLIRGNHDMQHLNYAWAECSGYNICVGKYMSGIKEEFLAKTQWVYVHDKFVFSHAGVSEVWLKNIGLDDLNKINELEPSEKFAFWPCKMSDYSGVSSTQPLTWIRPWTLVEYAYGDYTYVVGHTHYGNIINIREECIKNYQSSWLYSENDDYSKRIIEKYTNANDIYCCDALPKEYLIIEDRIVSVGKLIS